MAAAATGEVKVGDAKKEAKGDAKADVKVEGLDDGGADEVLKLVSQELEKIPVPKKVAIMSELVKTMAEGDKEEKEIPLPNVKSAVLNKVVAYMKYHVDNPAKEIEKPLKSANMNEVVSQWDADFVDVDQELLFELILAANYMDIKPLLDLTCAKVASMIKGKTPEQIRKTFNITNDFTPEEEEAVRAENKWAEES
jgi:S-phase kinase-associated protein 1